MMPMALSMVSFYSLDHDNQNEGLHDFLWDSMAFTDIGHDMTPVAGSMPILHSLYQDDQSEVYCDFLII